VLARAVLLASIIVVATAPSAWPFTIADMGGRALTLPAPPQRIISLVPSVTELIFALGGQERLVGVTDFCDWPADAKRKPSVGGMISPSLETIVALRPDLVIATDSGNRQETVAQLDRLRIPVFMVHANRLAEMREVTARLGILTGRETSVAPLVDRFDARIRAVAAAVAAAPRPRVLYVLWPEPLIVPGRDAIVTELIGLAGGDSITANERNDYPRYSVEAAVAHAPEVIILARHGTGSGPIARDKWDRLVSLPAIKSGRVHAVDGNLMHRYGPRLADGVEQLARAIHPEIFR